MSFQVKHVPRKRPSELSCLFCDETGGLVQEPQPRSFITIQKAADRRKDEISEKIKNDPEFAAQGSTWHASCFSSYVSEEKIRRREIKLVKLAEAKESCTLEAETSNPGSRDIRQSLRGSLEINKQEKCLICGNVTRSKDKLFSCSELRAAEKIFNVARTKQDDVYVKISTCVQPEDLFAIEVKYHKKCYLDYIRVPRTSTNPTGRPSHKIPQEILMEAFEKLINEIKYQFSTNSFELSFLATRLAKLTEREDAVVENRTIKSLLVDKYGEKVLFSYPADQSKSSLVFMSNIPLQDVIEHIRNINSKNNIVDTAKQLRKELLTAELIPAGYLCDETLIEKLLNDSKLPETWATFMQALFSAKNKKLSDNYYRRALSVFYDVFFTITEKQTPKHIALAESIHHLTRSKHLINVLNKFGHCINYKSLKNLDKEITTSIVCEDADKQILIPKNLVRDSSLFLHGAIDNNDFNEETLSGKDSTHVTAMVIYQEQKNPECQMNVVKLKPTAEYNDYNLKTLNCQEILHFETYMQPTVPIYKDSSCLLTYDKNNSQFDNLLWVLCRLQYNELDNTFFRPTNNSIPGWTPFQQILSSENIVTSTVGFSPIIPQPPTSKDVVYTAMKNYVNISLAMDKKIAVLSCDMAIYLIAKNIQQTSHEFEGLILRIGTFHLQKNFLRCLGQFIEGSGLDGILIEANVYGMNTLSSILKGTQYNRGIRAHKLLYEAIRSIQFSDFIEYKNFSKDELQQFNFCLQAVREVTVDKDHTGLIDKYNQHKRVIADFLTEFSNFLQVKSAKNDIFRYFNNYCEMVEILLNSIKADRSNDYDLHLCTTRQMLPYFFAMNHSNYIRGVTLYLLDMLQLPVEVIDDLKRGMLSVKRKKGTFNAVSPDLALEQSQNRSSAVTGGLIGITKNEDAMQRWMLLYPFKNSIHEALCANLDLQQDATSDMNLHNEWTQSRINKDQQDIENIIHCFNACNPYKDDEEVVLRNIFTGELAHETSTDHLLNVVKNGETLLTQYDNERFVEKTKKLSDPIKRNTFYNFENTPGKENKNTSNKKLTDVTDVTLVQKTFMLANQREFDIKLLASHELLDYCKYLFNAEGFYRKSLKSELALEIKSRHNCATNTRQDVVGLNDPKIYIVDGMALVHQIQLNNFKTFGEFGAAFFQRITNLFSQSNVQRVDVVFDRYDNVSIKFLESTLRSKGQNIKNIIISSQHTKIPTNSKNFLLSTANKLQLVRFLCTNAPTYVQLNEDCEMYICGGFEDPTKCFKLKGSSFSEAFELNSNHLEADSRMFCHMFHAVRVQDVHIIILSADTDVFILGIHFWNSLARLGCLGLWFHGSHKKKHFLGCHLAAESLGENICHILPALHAVSGCDTTSRFGTKKNWLNAASLDFVQKHLAHLEKQNLSINQLKELETVCTYIFSKVESTADELRYKLISQKIGFDLNLMKVICTSDALHLHLLRATAQTYFWINAYQTQLQPINFNLFGYEEREGNLYPRQMTKRPLPESLIEPCKCASDCRTMACNCKKNQLTCILLCKCNNNECKNIYK